MVPDDFLQMNGSEQINIIPRWRIQCRQDQFKLAVTQF